MIYFSQITSLISIALLFLISELRENHFCVIRREAFTSVPGYCDFSQVGTNKGWMVHPGWIFPEFSFEFISICDFTNIHIFLNLLCMTQMKRSWNHSVWETSEKILFHCSCCCLDLNPCITFSFTMLRRWTFVYHHDCLLAFFVGHR